MNEGKLGSRSIDPRRQPESIARALISGVSRIADNDNIF